MRFLCVASLSATCLSCGLPTIPFLASPTDPLAEGTNTENLVLTFRHNTENDGDDFRGYELYYKLYVVGDSDRRDADINFIATGTGEPGPNRLVQRGYVRAVATTERDPDDVSVVRSILTSDQEPHLPTNPTGSPVQYSIDLRGPLNQDADSDVIVAWDQGTGNARGFRRRSIGNQDFGSDPTRSLDSFWNVDSLDSDDWDVQQMGLDDALEDLEDPLDRLEIVMYSMAYGTDGTTFAGYFSEPLQLPIAQIVLTR